MMKKCLLLVSLLIVSQLSVRAQLINGPDTVCMKQIVKLTSNVTGENYHWGFCSGYLLDPPVGSNIGDTFGLSSPACIDVVRDTDGKYYGFVVNTGNNTVEKLNFGDSLTGIPTVTTFDTLPKVTHPNSLYIIRDSSSLQWFLFVVGGTDPANSSLARLDFGKTLANDSPNVVNMGNLNNALYAPTGLFIALDKTTKRWTGYCVNNVTSELVYMDFSFNISYTPVLTNEGNVSGALAQPTDMAGIYDGGNWYLFVTNYGSSTIARIDLGTDLASITPTAASIGDLGTTVANPTAISIVRDCDNWYGYITDGPTNQFVRMQMPAITGPYTGNDYGDLGAENMPDGLSRIIRDQDNLFAFITNNTDNSLTRITFPECHSSTIESSDSMTPPWYEYDTAGIYNIYFAVDEGLPTMQFQCKTIVVLPIPPMDLTPDTLICQGDTVSLRLNSSGAYAWLWKPQYNIYDTTGPLTHVYPTFSTTYYVEVNFPHNCIVDTNVHVDVSKVYADAGPDRDISDGASTILGGPLTTTDGQYEYKWYPYEFLSNDFIANPVASPPYDLTYYLQVVELNDSLKCSDIDTVIVHVGCGDFDLPNAFVPGSDNPGSNKFGILNKEIVKLNYFRIFDRWGNLVFETSDPTQKWDGMEKDRVAPFGVYVWEADGFCISGKRITKSGNVTLLR